MLIVPGRSLRDKLYNQRALIVFLRDIIKGIPCYCDHRTGGKETCREVKCGTAHYKIPRPAAKPNSLSRP